MKRIRDILVASDLSARADVVVQGASTIAAQAQARLHVMHVYEFHPAPYLQSLPREVFQKHLDGLRTALRAQVERTTQKNVDVASQEVVVDSAQRAILKRAQDVAADLIVIGRHRREGIADAFLGGTADSIVRSAQVPVLILPRTLQPPLRRVLVPIDLSEPALHALDVAVAWAGSFGSEQDPPEIIVLHVLPQILDFKDALFDSTAVTERLHEEIAAACTREGATTKLHAFGVVRWAIDTAAEITRFSEQENIDLVVLGTHGYGAMTRALLGSVSSKVARSANGAVLLVPPALAPGD